jgi:hypothetical protein
MKKELWRLIYMGDGVHLHAARIIGYAGCTPFGFYDAAKLLPNYDQRKFQLAMEDLTSYHKRTGSDPRYEFNAEARKAVRALLGPPPDDPSYEQYWSREVFQPGMTEPHVPKPAGKPAKGQMKPARKATPKKAKPAGRTRKRGE